MPRRSYLKAAGLAAIAALNIPMLVACGSSTPSAAHVTAFQQTAGSATPCRAIVSALPKVLNQKSPLNSTNSPFGASWGNPAIVLRCGVPVPSAFTSNNYASCLTVNGVDWYLSGGGTDGASPNQTLTVTTVYRSPAVEVTVPGSYGTQGPSTAMALLTNVIKANTKATNHCL